MKAFVCNSCGHVAFDVAPEACPVCGGRKFTRKDDVFTESAEKSKEAAVKHIPSITVGKECALIPGGVCVDVLVVIGATVHPMEEKHHISFADCYVDGAYVSRQSFTPGVYPGALFHLKKGGSKVRIVENCNVHGYWTADAAIG